VNTYDKGDLIRLTGVFQDSAGADQDPDVVVCKVKTPTGTVTTYTYGTDAELIKESTGNYYLDFNADVSGTYFYRFHSTGNGKAAGENSFEVVASNF
jgi:hypothetical protein